MSFAENLTDLYEESLETEYESDTLFGNATPLNSLVLESLISKLKLEFAGFSNGSESSALHNVELSSAALAAEIAKNKNKRIKK
jgi:hypothetical protein